VKRPGISTHITYFLISAGAILFLASCGEQPFGIFASIEREADAEDSAFFGANLRGMARLTDGDGIDRYIVASGRPQWRRVDSPGHDNWSNAPRPSDFNDPGDWMTSVVGNGSDVYALFKREGSSNTTAVFKWEANDWSRTVSNTSAPFDDRDSRISRLFLLNGTLVASVRDMDSEKYTLIVVHENGGEYEFDDSHRSDTGSGTPISDATHDGADYYFVSQDGVWSGDNVANLTEDDDAPSGSLSSPPHSDRGVYYYYDGADDYVFLAANKEIWYKNSNAWSKADIGSYRSGDRFTRFAEFDGHIFVGSDREGSATNGGVYRLNTADLNSGVEFRREFDKPSDSPIYRSHIAGLYADDTTGEERLFALVYSRPGQDQPGLWRRDNDDADSDWSAE